MSRIFSNPFKPHVRHVSSLRRWTTNGLPLLCLAFVTACATVGPDYQTPATKIAATWQAAVPHQGSTHSLLEWWRSYNAPILTDLLRAAEGDHSTLLQAAAAIASARANRDQAAANTMPSLSAGATATRSGSLGSGNGANSAVTSGTGNSAATQTGAISTVSSASLDASWEIDLFGAGRRNNEAANARVEARQADWHDARVSLAAEVASEYVSYRACALLSENSRNNLESLRKTANSTAVAVAQGLVAPANAILINASVANAAASLNVQEAECEIGIKALVALTGLDEPALRAKLGSTAQKIPNPEVLKVTTLPVQLLSQRPDLVSAERSLAAASAEIGVAEANRYPRLSLLGSISVSNTQATGTLIKTTPWSFGPSLTLPLFDGGSRRADVARARATYESALASYQGAVRKAIRETEQSLVRLYAATRRSEDVVRQASRAATLVLRI